MLSSAHQLWVFLSSVVTSETPLTPLSLFGASSPYATPKVLLIEIANISSLSFPVNILPDLTFLVALAISKRLSHVI